MPSLATCLTSLRTGLGEPPPTPSRVQFLWPAIHWALWAMYQVMSRNAPGPALLVIKRTGVILFELRDDLSCFRVLRVEAERRIQPT